MYRTKSKLWKWQNNKVIWHFLTVSKTLTKKIKNAKLPKSKGWGSIRVNATISKTTWPTSIFPSKEETFVLPIKASVRKREMLKVGDIVDLKFEPVLFD
jgi:hypothetical protein